MRIAYTLALLASSFLYFGCVPVGGSGGSGGGGSGGSGGISPADAQVETDGAVCTPDCTDRVCGPDGCGGECGVCPDERICTAAGECLEVPATCGDDTCAPDDGETCESCPADCGQCCGDGMCTAEHGEHCGTCPSDCGCPDGEICDAMAGVCGPACVPDCEGRQCGPDGCEGTCGDCGEGEVCGGDGTCAPPPDGCGDGACGEGEDCANCEADCACEGDQLCEAGACVEPPRCGDGACDPNEDCGSCLEDCPCDAGQSCEGGACVDPPRCGDGTCDAGETCGNCLGDCPCAAGERCEADACVDGPRCGDGVCDADEDCGTCGPDCGCDAGFDCVNAECVCLPNCADAVCGDDGCGGTCGDCPDGAACAGGECVFECANDCGAPWVGTCTDDGFGYRLCIPDAERPGCTVPSRRIPCGERRECGGEGVCDGQCVKPEVIVLIDRSSSMIGERWAFTRAALESMAETRAQTARLGLRTFPGQADGCAAGGITPPVFDAEGSFRAIPDPAQVAQTPIAAAFDGVEAVFGDPDEGESVILLTDGDETCEDEFAAVARAEALRRRGVRTFVVGITRQANGELLSAIARAGGTAPEQGPAYYTVEDGPGLLDALGDIFTRLETCVCIEGEQRCADDRLLEVCAEDGLSFAAEPCPFGCEIGADACFEIPDTDGDGARDPDDNCPEIANADQRDIDRDGHGDVCDNCPVATNPGQADGDRDGWGDVCDNCAGDSNRNQADGDRDGAGDACDVCPDLFDPEQLDVDGDGLGDVCDNCPDSANRDQRDADRDGRGDACPVERVCEPCGVNDACPGEEICLTIRLENFCAPPCEAGDECGPGLECAPIQDGRTFCVPSALTCTDQCANARCPAGTVCNRYTGGCEPVGVVTCGECQFEEQCLGEGSACLVPRDADAGFCSPPCAAGCPDGFDCQDISGQFFCIPPNVMCVDPCADAECPPWQACSAEIGACLDLEQCADQGECPPGAYCDAGSACRPTGLGETLRGEPCGADRDCASGLVCGRIDAAGIGTCTPVCDNLADCQRDGAPGVQCAQDPSDGDRDVCRDRD